MGQQQQGMPLLRQCCIASGGHGSASCQRACSKNTCSMGLQCRISIRRACSAGPVCCEQLDRADRGAGLGW